MKPAYSKIVLLILFTLSAFFCVVGQKQILVFESGTNGFNTFRIPAIIQLPDKTLLAFCEGRVNGAGDFGNIKIVMKASRNGGISWGPLQTVVDAGVSQAGNPAPVVDLTDPEYPKGRIFLFYNTGNNQESAIRKGNGLREVLYKTSVDGGATWGEAVNITLQTHKPYQPQINPLYNFKDDWRSYANTPGHAIQFSVGRFNGRIFVAANHSQSAPKPKFTDYSAHGFYTDDHGKTFHISGSVTIPGSNESTAVQLSENKLMMNSRNQKGDTKARIISISSDGGNSWDTSYFDKTLIDPVNEASILLLGYKKGKAILAFCNAADSLKRDHLSLRISYNEGYSWTKKFLIDKNPVTEATDYTAYSDIVNIDRKRIGILYEKDGYRKIVFTVLKWK